MNANGSERMDYHGGRRVTIPGIPGVVEVLSDTEVIVQGDLSPEQYERLFEWMQVEWPQNTTPSGGY